MQASYPAEFTREMGCTEAEWLRLLPAAIGEHASRVVENQLNVTLASGKLTVCWTTLSPRVIGLVRLPRLQVTFCFDGLSADERHAFMRRFDLYMHRGGG